MRIVHCSATVFLVAIAAVSASAQPIISAKSGIVAGIEGKVLIDGQEVQQSVTHFPEVKEGAVLSTQDGRVELMLPPGFMLRMGENGALKMLANRLVDTRLELQAGSAVVEVDQTKEDYGVSIALKDGTVKLSKVGVYRFNSDPAQLRVFHGTATVEIGGETVMVGTGRMVALAGEKPVVEKFDAEQTDALDNWSRRHAEAMALANISGAKYANENYSQMGSNGWMYNPYFDMYTYVPMSGRMCNPFYGMCYYSPAMAYQMFYVQPMFYGYMPSVGGRTGVVSTGLRNVSIGSATGSAQTNAIGSRAGSYSGVNTSSSVSPIGGGIRGGGGSSVGGGGGISGGGGGAVGGGGGAASGGGIGGGHAGGGGAAAGGAHGK